MRKKNARRLQLKRETLKPLAGGVAAIDIHPIKNTNQDCTSPLCGPTTCPASCDCQTQPIAGVNEGEIHLR